MRLSDVRLRLRARLPSIRGPAAWRAAAEALERDGAHLKAARLRLRAAESGDAAAAAALGRAYLFGRGVPASLASALPWLKRAAEGNDAEAQTLLAELALIGITPAADGLFAKPKPAGGPDYSAAANWALRAAEAGSASAEGLLGFLLESGPPPLRDPARAARFYRRSAAAGCPLGQFGWARVLLARHAENGGAAMRAEAITLLQAAGESLPAARCLLGHLAQADADPQTALGHFEAAAERGYAPAQRSLGLALLRGDGVPADPFRAETWLRRAALGGETEAAVQLGNLYACAGSLPPNRVEAALWYRQAAEAGHPGAAVALGRLQLQQSAANLPDAATWFRSAAATGDASAREELGRLALARLLPEADAAATFRWMAEAAAAGDPAALFNLGLCHAEALGTARDDGAALACFRAAAPRVPEAAFWLGRMVAEGRGAAPDPAVSRGAYLAGAEAGLADAAAAAGEMLANGRGGPRDPEGARALFARAAAVGHAGAARALRALVACHAPPMGAEA